MNVNKVMKELKKEWKECPFIKELSYKLLNGEHLSVELSLTNKGMQFSFDLEGLPTYFSGDVIKTGPYTFLVKADVYSLNTLHDLLECVDDEITVGYLIPNGLYLA